MELSWVLDLVGLLEIEKLDHCRPCPRIPLLEDLKLGVVDQLQVLETVECRNPAHVEVVGEENQVMELNVLTSGVGATLCTQGTSFVEHIGARAARAALC